MVGNSTAWHPRVGMICTLKPASEEALAGIPGRVVAVWPRFRSGDYLVTLEYARPVKLNHAFITHLDVFKSELECLAEGQDAASARWPEPRPRAADRSELHQCHHGRKGSAGAN